MLNHVENTAGPSQRLDAPHITTGAGSATGTGGITGGGSAPRPPKVVHVPVDQPTVAVTGLEPVAADLLALLVGDYLTARGIKGIKVCALYTSQARDAS